MMPAIAELRQFAKRYTLAWCNHQAAKVASFYSPRMGRCASMMACRQRVESPSPALRRLS